MRIEKSQKFKNSIQNILDYIISKDGINRSKNFYKAVNEKLTLRKKAQ